MNKPPNKRILWFAVIVFILAGAGIGYAAIPQNTIRQDAGIVMPTVNATLGYYVGANQIIDNTLAADFVSVDADEFYLSSVNKTDIFAYPQHSVKAIVWEDSGLYYVKDTFTGGIQRDPLIKNIETIAEGYITKGRLSQETIKFIGNFTYAVNQQLSLQNNTIYDLSQARIAASPATTKSLIYGLSQNNVEIYGGIIDVDRANQVNTLLRGILIDNCNNTKIIGTTIIGATLAGIDIRGCNNVDISYVNASYNGISGGSVGAGIYVRTNVGGVSSSNIKVSDCVTNYNGLGAHENDGAGLQTFGAETYVIVDGLTSNRNTRYAVKLQCQGGSVLNNIHSEDNMYSVGFITCSNITMSNLYGTNNTETGIIINSAAGITENIILDNFQLSYSEGHGFYVATNSDNLMISNGLLAYNGGHGVYVNDVIENSIFKNIRVVDNDYLSTDSFSGFAIQDGSNVLLDGIVSYDTRAAGDRQTYGITVSNMTKTTIKNSHIYEPRLTGITIVSSSDVIVEGNQVNDCPSAGISITTSDDTIITNNIIDGSGTYDVNIAAATCERTVVKDNKLQSSDKLNDNGADTITHVLIVYVKGYNSTIGTHPAFVLPNGDDKTIYDNLQIPYDFQELVTAHVLIVPGGSGDFRRILSANWGKVCEGEVYNNGTDSVGGSSVAVTVNVIECFDISPVFTGIEPGDRIGFGFRRDGDNVLDTVEADCYYIGALIRYV